MKISLIVTTKNESETISTLLNSIAKQTRRPDEVIIADAHSTDDTWQKASKSGLPGLALIGVGDVNRAVGRNKAIKQASYEHILITDAGCRLKNTWVEEMIKGFEKADVVAGFYESEAKTVFEKCVAPYALVMPDKIDTNTFLPATRSMGITKKKWEKVGGFNENYRYAEDYEFARRIQKAKISIAVAPKAIVYWQPRGDFQSFARMIYEHAFGDGYARTFRPKVLTIYGRYILFIVLGLLHWTLGSVFFGIYILYSIQKNYRYVNNARAIGILPLLQIISDGAVMWGTVAGLLK